MKKKQIKEVRTFNRFYTSIIGLLNRHILNSKFSLPEARILFEINNNKNMTASDLVSLIHIDKGYLSRILKHFEDDKLIIKNRSENDKRSIFLGLTPKGKRELEILNNASDNQIKKILSQLSGAECEKLVVNLISVKSTLEKVRVI